MAAQEDFYVQLGLLIRRARVEAKLTQQDLADALSISRTSLTNIEKGKQRLLVHVLTEIADALGIETAGLLPPSDPEQQPSASAVAATVPANKKREFLASVLSRSRTRKK